MKVNIQVIISSALITTCTLMTIVSCSRFGAGTTCAEEYSFLPGECLNSSSLTFKSYVANAYTFSYYNDNGWLIDSEKGNEDENSHMFLLIFNLDLLCHQENLARGFLDNDFKFIPDNSVFQQFGTASKKISKQYDDIYQELDFGLHGGQYATIYYKGGLSLIADKVFGGYDAGENIGEIVCIGRRDEDMCVPGISLEDNMHAIGRHISLLIPIYEHEIVKERVTFNLSIPVKVGMYLTWLNDRLSDPDAELRYQDDTLSCTFTVGNGLR